MEEKDEQGNEELRLLRRTAELVERALALAKKALKASKRQPPRKKKAGK